MKMDKDGFLIRNINIKPFMSKFASLCNETSLHYVTLVCNDEQIKSFRALLALAYYPLMEGLKNIE